MLVVLGLALRITKSSRGAEAGGPAPASVATLTPATSSAPAASPHASPAAASPTAPAWVRSSTGPHGTACVGRGGCMCSPDGRCPRHACLRARASLRRDRSQLAGRATTALPQASGWTRSSSGSRLKPALRLPILDESADGDDDKPEKGEIGAGAQYEAQPLVRHAMRRINTRTLVTTPAPPKEIAALIFACLPADGAYAIQALTPIATAATRGTSQRFWARPDHPTADLDRPAGLGLLAGYTHNNDTQCAAGRTTAIDPPGATASRVSGRRRGSPSSERAFARALSSLIRDGGLLPTTQGFRHPGPS